jgi:ferric-dicitrate binding protein FerR (iron transport regulator)
MAPIGKELLDRFLKGLCTEEEAAAVETYFQEHPEDITLLDDYVSAGEGEELPDDYREEMLMAIERVTVKKSRNTVRVIRVWAAAAAMIALVAGWWCLGRQEKPMNAVNQPIVAAVWLGRHNADSKKITLKLPDSSEAILSPGATIIYRKDFGEYDKREVKVEGQVAFAVAKNEQQPFIVYSDRVKTTVLGTIFQVTAEKDSNEIGVRLLAGKVMVTYDPMVDDSAQRYVLAPGQEFVFNKANSSVVIRDFRNHGEYLAQRSNRLTARPESLANWYMFNNQTLSDVFDQLALLYNVKIQYSAGDLRNKYFIGKLEMKDSLSEIMRDIALLNKLSVTESNGKFVLKSSKP